MRSKFKRGKQLLTVSDFDRCESLWYIVYYDGVHPRTRHRGVLISLQYRTLMNYIHRGAIYEAIERGTDDALDDKSKTRSGI